MLAMPQKNLSRKGGWLWRGRTSRKTGWGQAPYMSSHRSPDPSGFAQKSLGWMLAKLLDHSRSVTCKGNAR